MSELTMAEVFDEHLEREPTGAVLLGDVRAFLARFVVFPSTEALTATALWVAHAHGLEAFESTPRIGFLSPEPGSGKTRAMEIVELLVPAPMMTLNASAAALFRKVSDPTGRPTVLVDECDTLFGPRASSDHEDIRGFINGGHRRGAMAMRCAVKGKEIVVEEYPCYAAVALAGLDDLPATIRTRAVVIRMRRRASHERVEPFRHRLHASDGYEIRDRLAAWCADLQIDTWPDMPDGIEDRDADVWEPLIALADRAGGHWPQTARAAAVALVAAGKDRGETLGIRLLRDVHTVMGSEERMSTEVLLQHLCALDEAPWGEMHGKPLDARGLARRLGKYEIRPTTVRLPDGRIAKGYKREDLVDTWARYLDLSPSPADSVTSVTAVTPPEPEPPTGNAVTDVTADAEDGREVADDLEHAICRECTADLWAPQSRALGLCARCAKTEGKEETA